MSKPNAQKPTNTTGKKAASLSEAAIKRTAARAAEASTRLEGRSVPGGYVRSEGVKTLLAEREAPKR